MSLTTREAQAVNDIWRKIMLQFGYREDAIGAQGLGDLISSASELPDQTGHNGEFLTTDGSDASWAAIPSPDLGDFTFTDGALDLDAGAVLSIGGTTATQVQLGRNGQSVQLKADLLPPGAGQGKVGDGGLEFLAGNFFYLSATQAVFLKTTGAPPAASVDYRGALFVYQGGGAGTRDQLLCCLKSAAGVYNWIVVADGGA